MSETNVDRADPEVAKVLRAARGRRWKRWLGRTLGAVALVAVVGAALLWRASSASVMSIEYQTEPIVRGDLEVTVTATGTLDALNTVEVGAEITGKVLEVNVEFNDRVTSGQVLATIDPEIYEAQVDEAQARLAAAYASLATAKTSAAEQTRNALRQTSLHEQGLTSDQELEAANASHDRSEDNVQVALAQVTVARASLKVANNSVAKAIIRSPIDGIVLDRSVEVGQTVTSGLQTPVLFTLATDLDAMRLVGAIDEADVGMVQEGHPATFTVDAYPGQEFESKVLAVKNMPTASSSVVTYEAWLAASNEKRLLRPGMTATAEIIVRSETKVLLIPNAALRFTPPVVAAHESFSLSQLMPGPPRHDNGRKGEMDAAKDGKKRTLWLLDGMGKPRAVHIETGSTDGTRTQVRSGALKEGSMVIVNAIEARGQRAP